MHELQDLLPSPAISHTLRLLPTSWLLDTVGSPFITTIGYYHFSFPITLRSQGYTVVTGNSSYSVIWVEGVHVAAGAVGTSHGQNRPVHCLGGS